MDVQSPFLLSNTAERFSLLNLYFHIWCFRGSDTMWCEPDTCGDIEGERVAKGDSEGEKLGDMAEEAKTLVSWLIGERVERDSKW